MNHKEKVHNLIALLILWFPVIVVWRTVPTNYYRNTWFYASAHLSTKITETGYISETSALGTEVLGGDAIQYWGKIGTDSLVPINSIHRSIITQISGIPPEYLSAFFPGYVVIFLFYLVIFKAVTPYKPYQKTLAAVVSIAPITATINYLNINIVETAILLMGIYALMYSSSPVPSKRDKLFTIITFLVSSGWCFYKNPVYWGILTATGMGVAVVQLYSRRDSIHIITTVSLSWLLPGLLARSLYGVYLLSAVKNILALNIGFPSVSGGSTDPTILPAEGYGLIVAVSILPLGVLGGAMVFKHRFYSAKKHLELSNILIIWGVVLTFIVLAHLAAGEDFLVARAYSLGYPLIAVATVIAFRKLKRFDRGILPLILAFLVITYCGVFYLQANEPHQEVETYQFETESWAQWTADHVTGLVIGDMKPGSALVDQGYYKYHYPQNTTEAIALLYSSNGSYCNSLKSTNSQAHVVYDQMYTHGLYLPNAVRRPVDKETYQEKVHQSNKIYANGEYSNLQYSNWCAN